MTTTTFVANTFDLVGFASTANFFKNLGVEIERRRNIKFTIKQLSALSTRELNDIGLSRGEIWDIAHSSYPKVKAAANSNLEGWV